MYQIIDKRATGKTGRLMLLAQEAGGIFVCANPQIMKERKQVYGFNNFDIISYNDYFNHNYPYEKMVFIDELDCFVRSLGNNLSGYSISVEENENGYSK